MTTDRDLLNRQRQPFLLEILRLDAQEEEVRARLEQDAHRLAAIRARRREIDGELLDIDWRFREGRFLRERLRRTG